MNSYNFFVKLIFIEPDKDYVENLFAQEFKGDLPGAELIQNYIKSAAEKSIDETVADFVADRTWLLQGTISQGFYPPYETTYVGARSQHEMSEVLHSINSFYLRNGFFKNPYASGSPAYIGTELAFMDELCKSGDKMFDVRKDFFIKHLGRWGCIYADEIIKFAKTDFWRGIGHFLKTFLTEETALYSEVANI